LLIGPTGKDCVVGIVTGITSVELRLGVGNALEEPLMGPTGEDWVTGMVIGSVSVVFGLAIGNPLEDPLRLTGPTGKD
jgi:hypothetical protein